jgi:TonB family protein
MTRDWKSWEGEVANKFPLRQYLGGSDTAATFLTDRSGPGSQPAAIKLVLADPEHPDARLSWWELTARLSHPNLLPIYETGSCRIQDVEICYIVMEYAEENLSSILPERALSVDETKEALRSILDGLSYVHGKGYVYGHLKAANVLAVGDQVKLSSDGLCGVGEPGKVLGPTTGYTAPEIANGGIVSSQADVWSLGTLISEMLTQKRPTADALSGAVKAPRLPEPFKEIVEHCLQSDPVSRWSVADIRTRLKAGAIVAERPASVAAPVGKSGTRTYMLVAGAVAAVLLTVGLFKLVGGNRERTASPVDTSVAQPSGSASVTPKKKDEPAAPALPAAKGGSAESLVPGKPSQRKMPDIAANASRTIDGKVKVKIKDTVDVSGNVTTAKLESAGPSKYFASKSLEAARQWKFVAPKVNGEDVASNWLITFEFTRRGIDDHVEQIEPAVASRKH